MSALSVHYSPGLVTVSILISICASYAALSLSDRVRAATTSGLRRFWLTGGSVAMGVGIWSMHYLGMLALELPVPVFYFWPTVLLSLVLAIASSSVALGVVGRETLPLRRRSRAVYGWARESGPCTTSACRRCVPLRWSTTTRG